MTTRRALLVLFAVIGAVPVGGALAAPVNFADHLQCRSIRDLAPHIGYTADFVSNELGLQTGCVIRTPAKQICWAAQESNLVPAPFPAPLGPNLVGHWYLCYRARCPKDGFQAIVNDELGGARYTVLRQANTICVPAN
jgi:hypothetical protein